MNPGVLSQYLSSLFNLYSDESAREPGPHFLRALSRLVILLSSMVKTYMIPFDSLIKPICSLVILVPHRELKALNPLVVCLKTACYLSSRVKHLNTNDLRNSEWCYKA